MHNKNLVELNNKGTLFEKFLYKMEGIIAMQMTNNNSVCLYVWQPSQNTTTEIINGDKYLDLFSVNQHTHDTNIIFCTQCMN